MKRTIVESPYAGNTESNLRYLRACLADSIARGEAPFASHGLYTQPGVLDDGIPDQRALGIDAGFAWREAAEMSVFYIDLGWSAGMRAGQAHCMRTGLPHEVRTLGAWDDGLCATDRWTAPKGVVTAEVGPIRAEDLRLPTAEDVRRGIAEDRLPTAEDIGRGIAEVDGIHVPDVLALEPRVVVGPRTLDHAARVAETIRSQIAQMPLTQQAGDTIAVALAVLHYRALTS